MTKAPLALLLFLLFPGLARAGGSFDGGYGIWSPSGLWHRVTAPACVSPHSGTACVYYGIDAGCNYANGTVQDASLTTLNPVSLTASTAFISFWLLYEVQSYDPACQDRLRLEYSPDGVNWYLADYLSAQADPVGGSPVEAYASGSGLGGPPLWQFERVDLQSFAGTYDYWRFRYVSSDELAGNALCGPPDLLQQFLGYAIDAVSLGSPAPPLSVSKSVSPAFAAPGDTFTFTLSAVNTGSGPATLSLWDTLPAGYAYAAAPGGSVTNGLAQWSFPGVAAGQSATAQLQLQAAPGLAAPADWINTAAAASSLTTTAVCSSQVLAKIRTPVLALSKSVSPSQLTSGDVATYNIVIENDSPLTQSALTLTDELPAAFSATEVYPPTSGAGTWSLGSVAPGQILSFALWGPVYGEDGQVVVNSAQVLGTTTTATATASLTVHKAVQPSITLSAVYPNPAPSHNAGQPQEAFVAYTLSAAMTVTLDIYDVAGEKVRSLGAPGQQGPHQVAWDLNNAYGRPVASGLYVLRLWSPLQVQPLPQATGYLAVLR